MNDSTKMQRQLSILRSGFVALTLAWIGTTAWIASRTMAAPSVLTVERIEVVEPDGTPALVLSNSQRPIAATVDGQVLMEGQEDERRGIPSIIFFDGKGDEVGGILFGVQETGDGYNAVRHLSFDAYKQDQTVVISHYQDPSGARSGLTVSDRPNHSILETQVELGLAPTPSRDELRAAIQAIPEEERAARLRDLFGATRAFVGTDRDGNATLVLMDGSGRDRVVIEAPEEGDPSIRLLDEEGTTVSRLPGR